MVLSPLSSSCYGGRVKFTASPAWIYLQSLIFIQVTLRPLVPLFTPPPPFPSSIFTSHSICSEATKRVHCWQRLNFFLISFTAPPPLPQFPLSCLPRYAKGFAKGLAQQRSEGEKVQSVCLAFPRLTSADRGGMPTIHVRGVTCGLPTDPFAASDPREASQRRLLTPRHRSQHLC
jgi:hypothetical protein